MEKTKEVIDFQFQVEKMFKRQEISVIQSEIFKANRLKAQIQKWQKPADSSFLEKRVKRKAVYSRLENDVFIKLVCYECKRSDFGNRAAFVNHCRSQHGHTWNGKKEYDQMYGVPVDASEVPFNDPSRLNDPSRYASEVPPSRYASEVPPSRSADTSELFRFSENAKLEIATTSKGSKSPSLVSTANTELISQLFHREESTRADSMDIDTTLESTKETSQTRDFESTKNNYMNRTREGSFESTLTRENSVEITGEIQKVSNHHPYNQPSASSNSNLEFIQSNTNLRFIQSNSNYTINREESISTEMESTFKKTDSERQSTIKLKLDPMQWEQEQHPGKVKSILAQGPLLFIKKNIIVGNVSSFVPIYKRDNSKSTHRWLLYLRASPNDNIPLHAYISRIKIFLHPSYRPNEVVEIIAPPFQLGRTGWGEFPIRIQIHFHDSKFNRPIDIYYNLSLGKENEDHFAPEKVIAIELDKRTEFKETKDKENLIKYGLQIPNRIPQKIMDQFDYGMKLLNEPLKYAQYSKEICSFEKLSLLKIKEFLPPVKEGLNEFVFCKFCGTNDHPLDEHGRISFMKCQFRPITKKGRRTFRFRSSSPFSTILRDGTDKSLSPNTSKNLFSRDLFDILSLLPADGKVHYPRIQVFAIVFYKWLVEGLDNPNTLHGISRFLSCALRFVNGPLPRTQTYGVSNAPAFSIEEPKNNIGGGEEFLAMQLEFIRQTLKSLNYPSLQASIIGRPPLYTFLHYGNSELVHTPYSNSSKVPPQWHVSTILLLCMRRFVKQLLMESLAVYDQERSVEVEDGVILNRIENQKLLEESAESQDQKEESNPTEPKKTNIFPYYQPNVVRQKVMTPFHVYRVIFASRFSRYDFLTLSYMDTDESEPVVTVAKEE